MSTPKSPTHRPLPKPPQAGRSKAKPPVTTAHGALKKSVRTTAGYGAQSALVRPKHAPKSAEHEASELESDDAGTVPVHAKVPRARPSAEHEATESESEG